MVPDFSVLDHLFVVLIAKVITVMLDIVKQEALFSHDWDMWVAFHLIQRDEAKDVAKVRCHDG